MPVTQRLFIMKTRLPSRHTSLFLNSQGMSAEKQVPQTTNINSVGELTCTDFQRLLTPTDP